MIIVGGSYYDNSSNICPILIKGRLIKPEYSKIFPSLFEGIETPKGKMKSGKFVFLYETSIGTFSVLTCFDFPNIIYSLTSEKIDFVINPCYDPQISRFQKDADSVCRNNEITIIHVNRTNNSKDKFGKSGIITKEHHDIIARNMSDGYREKSDPDYLIAKLNSEEILIADINLESKGPTVGVPLEYHGRSSINKIYRYDQCWIAL
ncbi:MAG: hypothetical protein Q7U51_07295 [Methanoregula sp.]|nr:hypothetical protein [Methanoregula sp.]